jgi:hypothetical protein
VTEVGSDDWGDAEEETWYLGIRPKVIDYLKRQGVIHRRVGEIPAWHLAPHISIWAIESQDFPGVVGWWVICGNLPTDYCSSHECRHPRLAMRRIAEHWQAELRKRKPGDEFIGSTGIPATFTDLLTPRTEMLLEFADADSLWPEDVYG